MGREPGVSTWRVTWKRVGHLTAAAGWIALILPLAVVLLSVALSPDSNWTVRAALAGFCVLAIARPADALLVTCALVGFGIILSHLAGVPALRVTEVLVVGSLAGYAVRALARGTAFRRALVGCASVPVALFAIAAVASTLVWLRVSQFESGYPSSYVHALLLVLIRDYFVQPGDFWVLVSTAALLEGLALYVVAAALCHIDASFFERALRMLTLGGAALAVMSVVRLAEILLRSPHAIEVLRATNAGLRISPQIPDYIAAGSYFALCWLIALGLAVAGSRRRLAWLAASVPLMAGLYLTGSRSVIAAALGGLIVLVVGVVRQRVVPVRGVIAFAMVAVVVMVISFPWMVGHDVVGETARQSLKVRVELIRTGLRVIATRPLFGVGIDRFFLVAGPLASPELNALWPSRKNPHNDFLRFGGELGLVGLGLFLSILALAGRRVWQALRGAGDARLAGLVAGLVAFLITSLASNPLMLREVSYVFWIGLGLAVGHSSLLRDVPERAMSGSTGLSSRIASVRWPIALLVGGLLFLSIPFRARQELGSVNLRGISYGLFDWGMDADGTRCRLSGPRATFYVDGRAQLVEIPLKGTLPSGVLQRVEVRVEGRLADRVAVGAGWQRLRTLLPADPAAGPRRIDLLVSPSWVPAEVIPGSRDRRALGVKVGEIKVLTTADH
jgi:O-antigen ligase